MWYNSQEDDGEEVKWRRSLKGLDDGNIIAGAMGSVRCVTNRDCTVKAGSYTVRTATASKKAIKIGLGRCRKDAMGGGMLDGS